MKNRIFALGFTLAIFLLGSAFTNPIDDVVTFKANTVESNIVWKGYKVTGSHTGSIALKSGELQFDEGVLKGGSFEIDMATLAVTDLEGKMAGKLAGHLKSADFFGVEAYPTAKFNISKAVPYGKPGEYKIVGDLTIKETTKEIKFMASVDSSAASPVAIAKITIDRSDFDVRYGSGSFFENLGDKTIYDEFELEVKLVVDNQ